MSLPNLPIIKTNSRWDTKKGLLYNINIFSVSLLFVIALVILKIISINFGKYLLFIPNALFLFAWVIRRSYFLFFFSKKICIVFSLNLEEKKKSTIRAYRETIQELNRRLLENNLEKYVKARERPYDIKFKSKTAAEAKTKLGLPGSILFIWGNIIESSGKYKLFFSYEFGYPGRKEEYYKSIFANHVDKAMINRLWNYKGPESVEILADDLLQVSLFITGSTAITVGRLKMGSKLFEIIKSDYNKADLLRKKNLGKFILEVDRMLVFSYRTFLMIHERNENYKKNKFFADKILEINYDRESNYFAHIALAIFYEEKGNRRKSKAHTRKAEKIHPPKQNSYILNNAYYAIAEYRFDDAIRFYKELLSLNHDANYSRVRCFLAKKGRQYNNLGFYFAEAFIAHFFENDLKYSKREFKKLIKKMKNDKDSSKYKTLILTAKELIRS